MTEAPPNAETLKTTPLDDLHRRLGARMVPFAGYAMPVQYPSGVLAEHLHTREKAGLFDVSHMGQIRLRGADRAARLERQTTADVAGLGVGRMRYTLFTDASGGILDDLMITNAGDHLYVVVNAACKAEDSARLEADFGGDLERVEDHALLALQGPAAEAVLAALCPEAAALTFMTAAAVDVGGIPCFVTRSGYTGEDGFEISVPNSEAEALAERLLAHPDVAPIGLGARDSLRLEAGLCLYGHDIDTTTSPIEASLAWAISKRRRTEGGFPGAERILGELAAGPARRRVGLRPDGRAPAREGTDITTPDGRPIGRITSGGYGPTVGGPVAMGYVEAAFAATGTELRLVVRGNPLPARVADMPFVPARYKRS